MGRLSKEEKLKKQAQKFKEEVSGEKYTNVPSEKMQIIKEIEDAGFKNISTDSVPIFHIDKKEDWVFIAGKVNKKFSYGVKGDCL